MKKKLLTMTLLTTILLTSCGSPEPTTTSSSVNTTVELEVSESTAATEQETSDNLEALGDISVDSNLFSVEITIPAEYVDGKTQEELTATAEEYGYKSITLNDDGSATYVMTKTQHEEMLQEMRSSINESLDSMVGSENYPNITDISTNDNFTEFTITTTSTELSLSESFMTLALYVYSGTFSIFSGETVDNVHVDFVNAETGEIINSADSKDMAEK